MGRKRLGKPEFPTRCRQVALSLFLTVPTRGIASLLLPPSRDIVVGIRHPFARTPMRRIGRCSFYAKASRQPAPWWAPLCPALKAKGTPLSSIAVLDSTYLGPTPSFDNGLVRTDPPVDSQTIDCGLADKVCLAIINSSEQCNYGLESALDQLDLPLTTGLVVRVLYTLRPEEKLALRFFMWAGKQDNYGHEAVAYNEMIDILTSTKYRVKQFRIVCDMLDYMKRNGKKVVPVEVLLMILRKYALKYLTHVRKFAQKKKVRVFTQPEINAFNLLLDAMCKCCLVEDAEAMFMRMRSRVKPDASTYNILFFGWCRVRNPIRAMQFLEEMIQLGYNPDSFTYNTAIDTFCKAGMVTEAAELFEFMRTKGSTLSSPTAKTYAILIAAMMRNDRVDECFKLLESMIQSGCLPDVSTYKELIEGMCLAGKIDGAFNFLHEMSFKGYPPDIVTYNCLLKVLCEIKRSDDALKLYERMLEIGCLPSVQTYNMLISMYFEIGDPDGAIETWQEMDRRGYSPDIDSYSSMIDGLFSCQKVEDACALIEEVVNKDMKLPYKTFESFLNHLSFVGDLRAIHKLSDHMRKFYNPSMARHYALMEKRKRPNIIRK